MAGHHTDARERRVIPSSLLPRRTSLSREEQVLLLRSAETVEVRDHTQLLAVPAGLCPLLCGDGVFAVGHGAVARAQDTVRVCVLEGGAVLAMAGVSLAVWEGGAAAGHGVKHADVGSGGWLWMCNEARSGGHLVMRASVQRTHTPEDVTDPPRAVVQGAVHVLARAGELRAGAGAEVHASDVAVVDIDPSIRLTVTEGRFVTVRRHPFDLPAQDPLEALTAWLRQTQSTPVPPVGRRVPMPWHDPDEPATALVRPLLEGLGADSVADHEWTRTPSGGWRLTLDVPLPESLRGDWALPPAITHLRRPGVDALVADGDVRVDGGEPAARHWWTPGSTRSPARSRR